MAGIKKRRGTRVIDYRDVTGRRRWETVQGTRKHEEDWLAREAGVDRSEDVLDRRRVVELPADTADETGQASDGWTPQERAGHLAERMSQPNPLDALIAAESADPFDMLLAAATPSQRRILLLLSNDLRGTLELTESKKSVAELLGFGPSRIDVAFHHRRRRMKDPR